MLFKVFLAFWSLIVRVSAPFFVSRRLKQGLEDSLRYKERYGITDQIRSKGDLIWFHGASVGESLSLLPLIQKIEKLKPQAKFLITTTTTAAQRVVSVRMSKNTTHQFIPFDAIKWVNKFLDHWEPKAAFFVESEIWPNVLQQAYLRNIPVTLLNARLSETSLRNWLWGNKISKKLWGCFFSIYTQSDEFTKRFHQLGATSAKTLGNIKLLSDKLPFNEDEYTHWKEQIKGRLCWVVASTHQGEEEIIFNVHKTLKSDFPNLLTIVVPRHVERCENILNAQNIKIARFTDRLLQNEDVLLVNAMGKLGVFYRLASVTFIGGSLVPVGGHNPLEPVMIGAFPLWGPHFFNVSDMIYLFKGMPCQQMDADQLVDSLRDMLSNPEKVTDLVKELQQRISDSHQLINQKIDEIMQTI